MQRVVVVNDDARLTVDVLDDAEWAQLNLVAEFVSPASALEARDDDFLRVVEVSKFFEIVDLSELGPFDTDARALDSESVVLALSIDVDLHDAFLVELDLDTQMSRGVLA